MARWGNHKRNNGQRPGQKSRVWCKHHNGYGPGPIRNWNGRWVCGNCYKTLTKFVLVRSHNRPPSKPKGFFATLFGL